MIKLNDKYKNMKSPNIPSIEKYKKLYGDDIIKLNYNESNFGPSPVVLNHKYILREPNRYPDYHATKLINRLIELYNNKFDENYFWISNGTDAIIDAIPSLFSSRGDNIIIPKLTYGRISQTCVISEIHKKEIPLKDGYLDFDEILNNIDSKTSIIYLVNPNMPTGTAYSEDDIINFIKKIPNNILIVIDEAYIEYSLGVKESYIFDTKLIEKFDNILITRTFSKLFALAGYRIGYVLSSKYIIKLFKNAIQAFPLSNISANYATKALSDINYYENIVKINKKEKDKYYKFFINNNLKFLHSEANFLYIDTSNEKWMNKDLRIFLLTKCKIWIRNVKDFALRITIGTPEQNLLVLKGIKKFLDEQKI